MSVENLFKSRDTEPEEEKSRIEIVKDRFNYLMRKEQGWNVKKQAKTEEGGLTESEKEELNNLSAEFKLLGGDDEWHRLRELKEKK